MDKIDTMGSRLKLARKKNRYTQKYVGEQVGKKGCVIADYENGKRGSRFPDIILLIKLARIYEVTTDWILLGEETLSTKSVRKRVDKQRIDKKETD